MRSCMLMAMVAHSGTAAIPQQLALFTGYNNLSLSKHIRKPMDATELRVLSQRLSEVTELPSMSQSSWHLVKTELQSLAVSLEKYCNYMIGQQQQSRVNKQQLYPV